ncbi:Ig-like domain-containing protein [Dactylococcopsis salina]|uniref:Protease n=1 Tax=Dactylococcopsis salina (strain PCC 8305) TaxID=13035 RepID=K9YWV8_DACS8|nr:pre-peptidase C-terminal domain-containing protein [Dactylococcopsis salina]AFZ51399.1 putative protease [Dactylococcopsis salina PCC 8305]
MVFQSESEVGRTVEELLEDLVFNVRELLIEFADSDQFKSVLSTSFGSDYKQEKVARLRSEFLSGDFLDEIEIEVLPSETLQGALGAYASENNTIYLSQELLVSSPQQANSVLLEEVGHAIDAFLNRSDTLGDEGAIFSALVRNISLSESQLQALETEDDRGTIVVDGETIEVEQATLTVTTADDFTLDDGELSLREAIAQANNSPARDIIQFDSSLSGETITLNNSQLTITSDLIIKGLEAGQITINGGRNNRVFLIDDESFNNSIDVTFSGLTISGGSSDSEDLDRGAGIYNHENLTLINTTISDNSATEWGGGIYNNYTGTLTLINSTISGNSAAFGGGGIFNGGSGGNVTLINSTISGNSVGFSSRSGGITNYGTTTLANSIIANSEGGSDLGGDGEIIIAGVNLVEDGSVTGGSIINEDPNLTPLQDNGGHVPLFNGPVIDAGTNGAIPADTLDLDGDGNTDEDIPFDQRGEGFDRVVGDAVDLGAVEVQGEEVSSVELSLDPTEGSEADQTTFTLTATASQAVSGEQTVELALSGDADADDFAGELPTTITLADGETTGSVEVTVNDDEVVEEDETVTFTISNPSNGLALGETVEASAAIIDNDDDPINIQGEWQYISSEDFFFESGVGFSGGAPAYASPIFIRQTEAQLEFSSVFLNSSGNGTGSITGNNLSATLPLEFDSGATGIGELTGTLNAEGMAIKGEIFFSAEGLEGTATIPFTLISQASPGGDDLIIGDEGDNVLLSGSGNDVLDGGFTGDDDFSDFGGGDDEFQGNSGQDTVFYPDSNFSDYNLTYQGEDVFIIEDQREEDNNGTDVLESIEQLVFDDQTVTLNPVELSINPSEGEEEDETVFTVTITALNPVDGDQSVSLSLSGDAVANDFVEGIPDTITIADGTTTTSVEVMVNDDEVVEEDETATFTISNPSEGLALGETVEASAAIIDNDDDPINIQGEWQYISSEDFFFESGVGFSGGAPSFAWPVDITQTGNNLQLSGFFLNSAGEGTGSLTDNNLTATLPLEFDSGATGIGELTGTLNTEGTEIEGEILFSSENLDSTATIPFTLLSQAPPGGDDEITGDEGNNVLAARSGNDTLRGLGGDDILLDSSGNDRFIGGPGEDTVLYGGTFSDYNLILEGEGFTIEDLRNVDNNEETDTLEGIEELFFSESDETITLNPVVELSLDPTEGSEADQTTFTLTATASQAVSGEQTVELALSGGADADDFAGELPTTITLADGETTGSVQVMVNDDEVVEEDETATFTISNPSNGLALGDTVEASGAIIDNDEQVNPPSSFPAVLELSSLDGSNGFTLNGVDEDDDSGESVSSAGDVNGDGIDDLIIGADGADPNGDDSGESYVVFGDSSGFPATVELSSLDGSNGFTLNGVDEDDFSGWSVSSAGDVNGDGIADLIIGAVFADPNGDDSGESYVVFGDSSGFPATVELSSLNGGNGFTLNGVDELDFSGGSVSGAGDVNGDGVDDLIIGASFAGFNSGESYVVFGRATNNENTNRPPVFTSSATVEVAENTLNVLTVTANDPDNDTLTLSLTGGDDQGLFTINPDTGELEFNNPPDFENPQDSNSDNTYQLQVQADDNNGGTATETLNISVSNSNEAPVAENDTATTTQNTVLTFNASNGLLGNDSDPDSDSLTISTVEGEEANVGTEFELNSGALLTLNADGSYEYDPNGAFQSLNDGETATDSFTYTLSDGNGGTDTAEVTITVNGLSDNQPFSNIAGEWQFISPEDYLFEPGIGFTGGEPAFATPVIIIQNGNEVEISGIGTETGVGTIDRQQLIATIPIAVESDIEATAELSATLNEGETTIEGELLFSSPTLDSTASIPFTLLSQDSPGGDDLITGDEGDNFLVSGAGNDTLRGLAGNDSFGDFFGGGDDEFIGGDGFDVVFYTSGKASDYDLTQQDEEVWTIVDRRDIEDNNGTDRLEGIELLIFNDKEIPLPFPQEPNDTLASANNTQLNLEENPNVTLSGEIGDNNFENQDVDLYRVTLAKGQQLSAEINTDNSSSLDSILRIFDQNGTEVALNDDQKNDSTDSLVKFTVEDADRATYFVGVSGFDNRTYNPNLENSGTKGSTGEYNLTLTLTDSPLESPVNDTIPQAVDTASVLEEERLFREEAFIGDNATFQANKDVDLYQVQLQQGETITIDIDTEANSPLNLILQVFNANGGQVPQGFNNSGTAPDERDNNADPYLEFTAPFSGAYYVGISDEPNDLYTPFIAESGVAAGATGAYQIEISQNIAAEDAAPETNPNDTLDTATLITLGDQVQSTIGNRADFVTVPGLDVDIYFVSLNKGQEISISLNSTSRLDPVLRFFNSNGAEIAFNDDIGSSNNSFLELTIEETGNYYIGVSGFDNSNYDPEQEGSGAPFASTGSYELTVQEVGTVVNAEAETENDTLETATSTGLTPTGLTPEEQSSFKQTNAIGNNPNNANPGFDVDLFQVEVNAETVLTADINTANLDSLLHIFDENGNSVAFNDDESINSNDSFLEFQLDGDQQPGTYYVGVSGLGNEAYNPETGENLKVGAIGDYEIEINLAIAIPPENPTNDTRETAIKAELANNRFTRNGFIGDHPNVETDLDFYQVELSQGQTLNIEVNGRDSDLESFVELFKSDETDNLLEEEYDAGDFPHPEVSIEIEEDDTYFIRVSAFDDGTNDGKTGEYQLNLGVENAPAAAQAPIEEIRPSVNDDREFTNSDRAVTIDVLANDVANDDQGVNEINDDNFPKTTEKGGTVTVEDSSLIYTPDPDFAGVDTFTYTADNESGGSDQGTVSVTVNRPLEDSTVQVLLDVKPVPGKEEQLNDGLQIGEEFLVDVRFQDLLTENNPSQAVVAAYADLMFDPQVLEVVENNETVDDEDGLVDGIIRNPSYLVSTKGQVRNEEGLVNEVGGGNLVSSPAALPDDNRVFSLHFRAIGGGHTALLASEAGQRRDSGINIIDGRGDQRDRTNFTRINAIEQITNLDGNNDIAPNLNLAMTNQMVTFQEEGVTGVQGVVEAMEVKVDFQDSAGNPLSEVAVGDTFEIVLSAEDLRPEQLGVFSAFADVVYDTVLIDVNEARLEEPFQSPVIDLSNAIQEGEGLVNEFGGSNSRFNPETGTQKFAIFTATAQAAGLLEVSTKAAEGETALNTLFGIDTDLTEATRYGENTLNIVGESVKGADLVITEFDAEIDHVLGGETTVNLTVANEGDAASSGFQVEVLYYTADSIDQLSEEEPQVVKTLAFDELEAERDVNEQSEVSLPVETLLAEALEDDPSVFGQERPDDDGEEGLFESNNIDYLGVRIVNSESSGEEEEAFANNALNDTEGVNIDDIAFFPWDFVNSREDGVLPNQDDEIVSDNTVDFNDATAVFRNIGEVITEEVTEGNRFGLDLDRIDFDLDGAISPVDAVRVANRIGYEINPDIFEGEIA